MLYPDDTLQVQISIIKIITCIKGPTHFRVTCVYSIMSDCRMLHCAF